MNRAVAGAVLAIVLAGCGSDDKPTRASRVDVSPDLSTATFASDMRRSLSAVDEFMGVFGNCLREQGCALEERSEALGRIDATIRSAHALAEGAADPCGSAFAEVEDALQRQRRAVEKLQDAAGDADAIKSAMGRVDRSSDSLQATIDVVQTDC